MAWQWGNVCRLPEQVDVVAMLRELMLPHRFVISTAVILEQRRGRFVSARKKPALYAVSPRRIRQRSI